MMIRASFGFLLPVLLIAEVAMAQATGPAPQAGGTAPNAQTKSPVVVPELFSAAAKGDLPVVKQLLVNMPVDSRTTDGALTALMIASYFGHVDVVKLLLDRKASVNLVAKLPNRFAPIYDLKGNVTYRKWDLSALMLA